MNLNNLMYNLIRDNEFIFDDNLLLSKIVDYEFDFDSFFWNEFNNFSDFILNNGNDI